MKRPPIIYATNSKPLEEVAVDLDRGLKTQGSAEWLMRQTMTTPANHALHPMAAGHRGCNRRVLWPLSPTYIGR